MYSPVVPVAFSLLESVVGLPVPSIQTNPLSIILSPLSAVIFPERTALYGVISLAPTVIIEAFSPEVSKSTISAYDTPAELTA